MKKTTRLLAALLAVVMLVPSLLVPGYADASFTDVKAGSWYEEAVNYVTEKGFMNGVGDGKFAPNESVTRAMFVTVLYRMEGEPAVTGTNAFADVPDGRWFTNAVVWAADLGITKGTSATTFAPNAKITRQDMCTMLARYLNAKQIDLPKGEEKTFIDADKISGYAKEAVALCSSLGLIAGYEDGSFKPAATATRAQLAIILMRLDKALAGTPVDPVPMPAQSFNGEAGEDMNVSINAPEGALPQDAVLTVTRITDEAELSSLQEKVGRTVYAAADIYFSKDGTELEPEKEVEVQISLDGLENIENPAVIHVKDDGTVEYVNDVQLVSVTRGEGKALQFYAKDFSIYLISDGGQPPIINTYRTTYHFLNELNADGTSTPFLFVNKHGDEVDYQIMKDDELLEDPGKPVTGLEKNFLGWFIVEKTDDTYTYTTESIDFTQPHPKKATDSDLDVYVAPRFGVAYIVTFWDNAKDAAESEKHIVSKRLVYKDDNAEYASVRVDNLTVPSAATAVLTGWTSDDYKAGAETTYSLTEKPIWDEVSGSFNLYPIFTEGHWLRFYGGPAGSGAGYRPAIFVTANTTAADLTNLGTVTREGYDFAGWYYAGSGEDPYTGTVAATNASGAALNAADLLQRAQAAETRLYGHWTGKQVTYKVATWFENADDDNYSYGELTSDTGTAGTTTNVTATAVDGFTAETIAQQVIKGDGTTVVNVYYKRNIYNIYFHSRRNNNENSRITLLTITAKYGQDIHNEWPGVKAGTERYGSAWYVSTNNNDSTYVSTVTTMPLGGDDYYQMSAGNTWLNTKFMIQSISGDNTFSLYVQAPYQGGRDWQTTADDYTHIDGFRLNAYSQANANTIRNNATGDNDAVYEPAYTRSPAIGTQWGRGNSYTYENGYYTLSFYYLRNQYSISFNTQKPGAATPASMTGIYYEANIADVKGTEIAALNQQYKVGETSVTVQGEGTYIFQGWYDNADGMGEPFNFNQEMPAGNITLYAKWDRIWYRIEIEPRGGEILPDVNEVTYTWVRYGDKIEQYNIRRDYVEADSSYTGTKYYYYELLSKDDPDLDGDGYYSGYRKGFYITEAQLASKEAFLAAFPVFDTGYADANYQMILAHVDRTKVYKRATTEDNYAFVGWYDKSTDAVYDFDTPVTKDVTTIYARWRRAGLYSIQYHTENGTVKSQINGELVATDSSYADQATTKISYRPTNITSTDNKTYVFVGWKVADPSGFDPNDPGSATLKDTLYAQGDDFTVEADDADSAHYIHLVAVYELAETNPDTIPVTTITFDPNFPAGISNNGVTATTIEGVPLNTAIDLGKPTFTITLPNTDDRVESIPKYSCTGYDQIGWNTKADGTGDFYKMTDVIGVDNADPKANTLYAVWARSKFFVFHSSSGLVQAFEVPISTSGSETVVSPFDITQLVADGYLYGGYYKTYGGVNMEALQTVIDGFTAAGSNGWTEGTLVSPNWTELAERNTSAMTDVSFTAYSGASLTVGETDTRFWEKANAYNADDGKRPDGYTAADVNGQTMKPQSNTIYFLKEVPDDYLHSKYAFVYTVDPVQQTNPDPGTEGAIKLDHFYYLTVVDDACYKSIGFRSGDDYAAAAAQTEWAKKAAITSKFTIVQKACPSLGIPERYVSITPDQFSNIQRGYIGFLQDDSVIEKTSLTMLPSWLTLDGVVVGNAPLDLTITDNNITAESSTLPAKKLYVNIGGIDWWTNDSAETRIQFYNDAGEGGSQVVATQVGTSSYYSCEIPEGYTKVRIQRYVSGEWKNESVMVDLRQDKNCIQTFWTQEYDNQPNAGVTWKTYIQ